MAVTRQMPLGAAERVPNACAWTNSTREESFEPLVAHHLRLDTSSGPALRLLRYRQGAHHADARDAPIAAASLAHVSTDLSG